MNDFYAFNAVELQFPSGRKLWSFAIDGKRILDIASVSRAKRTSDGRLHGFQREAVKKHIAEIARYIASPDAMIPNAIVVAFSDTSVQFEPRDDALGRAEGRLGVLHVPRRENGDKPGWIVDGQQRTYAIAEAKVTSFPVFVTAFHESDVHKQMEHFVNVNSAKPLPRDLVNELLPNVENVADRLVLRKAAARIATRLAFDKDSPFLGVVKASTGKKEAGFKKATLQLNSLISPLEALLKASTSYLAAYVDSAKRVSDVDRIATDLKECWHAVKDTWPEAWGMKPTQSRLMHGTGMWAVMHLLSKILEDVPTISRADIADRLSLIRDECHWTADDGDWEGIGDEFEARPWDWFENTARDKATVTAFLCRRYMTRKRGG